MPPEAPEGEATQARPKVPPVKSLKFQRSEQRMFHFRKPVTNGMKIKLLPIRENVGETKVFVVSL